MDPNTIGVILLILWCCPQSFAFMRFWMRLPF